MFIANLGSRYKSIQNEASSGILLRATGQTAAEVTRREYNDFPMRLFDPQVYFLDFPLDVEEFSRIIARLSTYNWFLIKCSEYDSEVGPQRNWFNNVVDKIRENWESRRDIRGNWDECVTSSVKFQVALGVSHIILPATLISENSSIELDLDRLDRALVISREITDLPLLSSIPIEDSLLRSSNYSNNEFLESILDGFSSRNDGLFGYYCPIAMTSGSTYRINQINIAGAALRMVQGLAATNGKVFTNFIESLGLASLALGGAGFCSGYGTKEKRLFYGDYSDSGGGQALPKFFSANIGVDFYPMRDIEKRLFKQGLLRKILKDKTPASHSLFHAIQNKIPVNQVPTWAETRNNISTAASHYIQRMASITEELSGDPDLTLSWIQDAEEQWEYIRARFEKEKDPLECPDGRHLSAWRESLEKLLRE